MTSKQFLAFAFVALILFGLLLLPPALLFSSPKQPTTPTPTKSTPTPTEPTPTKDQLSSESSVIMVATVPVTAELLTDDKSKVPIRGRLSLNLETSRQRLENHTVDIKGFNLVFFDVSQAEVSKIASSRKGSLGVETSGNTPLQYDEASQTLTGEIVPMKAHFPQLDEIVGPIQRAPGSGPVKNIETQVKDHFMPSLQSGTMNLEIKLVKSLKEIVDLSQSEGQINNFDAELKSTEIAINKLKGPQGEVPGYQISLNVTKLTLQAAGVTRYKLVKKLCIQPVSFSSSPTDPEPTGKGFDFGLPGAEAQWGKGDIILDVRGWKTFMRPDLKTPQIDGAELDALKLVDEGDCVEVFFIKQFKFLSQHGGGYARGGAGTADVKLVIADAGCEVNNALLLAHELGHVLGLSHPGTNGPRSLMCPSTCLGVNVAVNSPENIQKIRNPLIRFELVERGLTPALAPDCGPGVDCGQCN